MSKKTKIWLIIAAVLVLAGLALMAGVTMTCNWDFTRLNTTAYETNTHEISQGFHCISINTDTADLIFVPAEDGKCRVVCYEETTQKHTVAVQDGTLTVHEVNTRKWYDHIGISFGTPVITVYLPDGEYGTLFIEESTGDIEIPKDLHFESMDITTSTGDITITETTVEEEIHIRVSTGKVNLTDIACRNLTTSGSTGDISLKRVIVADTISIERSTGDVEFDNCDAAALFIRTDTGDVEGTLRSDKVFYVTTDTGDINVPKSIGGGRCEITTDTGDIEIDLLSDNK